jgi:hypothetical protein
MRLALQRVSIIRFYSPAEGFPLSKSRREARAYIRLKEMKRRSYPNGRLSGQEKNKKRGAGWLPMRRALN